MSWAARVGTLLVASAIVVSPAGVVLGDEPLYRLDFAAITVEQLVEIVSAITGQNVILSAGVEVTRTIAVIAPRPLAGDAALELLSAALAAAGLRLEQRGEYWVIGAF